MIFKGKGEVMESSDNTCIVETVPHTNEKTGKVNRKKERNVSLDLLRGLLMLWVFFDHFAFDVWGVFRYDFSTAAGRNLLSFSLRYWNGLYRKIAHPVVLFSFFALSGLVTVFSKSKLKRAIKMSVYTILLFIVTFIAEKILNMNCKITIGVLYAFAVCYFAVFLLEKVNTKAWIYLVTGIILSVIGLLYIYKINWLSDKLFFLVFDERYFYSGKTADYFPILPYLGYFFIGMFFGKTFYTDKKPKIHYSPVAEKILSPITFIGRTSLIWYFVSQGIFVAIIYVLIAAGVL